MPVDRSHEMSTFHHGLECIMPRYSRVETRTDCVRRLEQVKRSSWTLCKLVHNFTAGRPAQQTQTTLSINYTVLGNNTIQYTRRVQKTVTVVK